MRKKQKISQGETSIEKQRPRWRKEEGERNGSRKSKTYLERNAERERER
jgi:hypothetical protein